MPKCSHCDEQLPTGFMGLYCPKCGKALWSGVPDTSDKPNQNPDEKPPQEDFTEGQTERPWSDYQSQETGYEERQSSAGIPIKKMSVEGERLEKYCPWEDRDEIGTFRAFFETIGQSVFHPNQFFGKLPPHGGYGDPILFAIIIGTLSAIVAFLWSYGYEFLGFQFGQSMRPPSSGFMGTIYFDLLTIVITPALMIIILFISSAIYHIFLVLLRGASNGYEATFRVVCYSMSSNIFGLIPCCGFIVAWLASIIMMSIGLSKLHLISLGKAVAAVLAPLFLVALFAAGFAVLVVLMLV